MWMKGVLFQRDQVDVEPEQGSMKNPTKFDYLIGDPVLRVTIRFLEQFKNNNTLTNDVFEHFLSHESLDANSGSGVDDGTEFNQLIKLDDDKSLEFSDPEDANTAYNAGGYTLYVSRLKDINNDDQVNEIGEQIVDILTLA